MVELDHALRKPRLEVSFNRREPQAQVELVRNVVYSSTDHKTDALFVENGA